MRARLVRIGNSRGLRLPKTVIEQVGLDEEVELHIENHRLVIAPVTQVRAGWADAARRLASESHGLIDPETPTQFDDDEWQW